MKYLQFQARFIQAMFYLLSNFYKDCSLQFVTCFWLQFSPVPPLVLFIISMVSWGFLLTKKIVINQPFSGPARHPLPLQFWCDIIVLSRGLTSIFVLFRSTNLQNKMVLHKPTSWSVLNPFLLVPKSENPLFSLYEFNVKDSSKYANLRFKNYPNSGRC